MRRLLSIALLFVFALTLVAPALGQATHRRMLLCCHKAGAHHCITSATMEDGSPAPTFRAHCTACPNPGVSGHSVAWIIGGSAAGAAAGAISELRIRQVEAGYRISFHRSRQKRGPPAVVLS